MEDQGLLYFALLKKEMVVMLKQSFPSIPPEIENWKGQDIVYFQDDLLKKVKGSISEKWFYTHIKLSNNKLPRIDMLNLLSNYAGYTDWNDFKEKNRQQVGSLNNAYTPLKWWKNKFVFYIILLFTFLILYFIFKPKTYTFCFIDADHRTVISNQEIEIIILNDGESPIYKHCKNGCFSVNSMKSKIRFIVKTPYYKIDTITRMLNSRDREERVQLHTNDYAMMIHFFSKSKLVDWQKRRKQLDEMFADNAQIYQLYEDENIGMEFYNKNEFINKLTMPLRSLQNIEIIETVYNGNRISLLKFRQTQIP
jgi:hypothetical protein